MRGFHVPHFSLCEFAADFGECIIAAAVRRGMGAQVTASELRGLTYEVLEAKLAEPPPKYPKLMFSTPDDDTGMWTSRTANSESEELALKAQGFSDEAPDGDVILLKKEMAKVAAELKEAEAATAAKAKRQAEITAKLAAMNGGRK